MKLNKIKSGKNNESLFCTGQPGLKGGKMRLRKTARKQAHSTIKVGDEMGWETCAIGTARRALQGKEPATASGWLKGYPLKKKLKKTKKGSSTRLSGNQRG